MKCGTILGASSMVALVSVLHMGWAQPPPRGASLFGAPSETPPALPTITRTPETPRPAAPAQPAANLEQTLPELMFSNRPETNPPEARPAETKPAEMRPTELGIPISVKGRFLFRGREPIVLLEAGGQILQVRVGGNFVLANGLQLRVASVNSSEVHLEVGPQKRPLVLH